MLVSTLDFSLVLYIDEIHTTPYDEPIHFVCVCWGEGGESFSCKLAVSVSTGRLTKTVLPIVCRSLCLVDKGKKKKKVFSFAEDMQIIASRQ